MVVPRPTTQPSITDEITLARYPFLPQASGWIQQMAAKHNITLDDLLEGALMEPARKRARIRLIDSVQSKEGVELSGGDIHTEEGRLIEAFSFYYARLVICASEDERLLARWSQAEAARAEHLLIRDSQNLLNIANTYISVLEQSRVGQSAQRGMISTEISNRFDSRKMVWSGNSALLILSKFVHELQETVGGYQIAMSMLGWFDFTMNKSTLPQQNSLGFAGTHQVRCRA